MSRTTRQHQPGGVVHVTSRTQGHEPWFTKNLRSSIARMIVEGVTSAGASLIAYAVMPNHVHIILAQGMRTLGWTMQPVMRRIALLVQRAHGVSGHVFERRYRSKPCLDADYLRAAILYTHFNPVKARLCGSVDEYSWTSHLAYCKTGEHSDGIHLQDVLRLFAAHGERSRDELRRDYLAHVEWWRTIQQLDAPATARPVVAAGTAYFTERYSPRAATAPIAIMDLRDRARRVLSVIARDCELDLVRGAYVGRRASVIRRQLIAALLSAGYRGNAIANFLKVSPSVVSRVSVQVRWQNARLL